MNRLTLLLRNIWYFRGVNLAVIFGMAVATAVLTGALMVGDSVRGSLADLALRRLGTVDYALVSQRFFNESLADRLGADGVAPAIIIRGGAINDSATTADKPRTADVQIAALGAGASGHSPIDAPGLPVARGNEVINGPLAQGLDITAPGATAVLSVPTQGDAPREAALAKRGRNDVLNQLRATVQSIDTGENFTSLFGPSSSQRVQRNSWVNLQDLQEAIDQGGRVNVLLAHAGDPHAKPNDAVKALNDKLASVIQLDDYGLSLKPVGNNEVSVFARETYIAPPAVAAATRSASALHIPLRKVSVNLINSVARVADGTQAAKEKSVIHYAVGAGISSLDEGTLAKDEIAINQWTADQLHAKVGDKLAIDFYLRAAGGDLTDASKSLSPEQLTFTVKYVLPMSGLGADPQLPPNYKGLTDAESVADWDPPEGLVIDKKLVTKADEEYWHKYHAAPKLFVNFETAQALWGGAYGDVTGLRIPAADADRFARQFLSDLQPQLMGLSFRPIKAEQLAAASGGTDFSMFFLMFSFFLIVAAALLVAMLFRLNVEQRARQLGLMSAVGFSPRLLRRLALSEGMLLALIGGIVGLGAAVGYTALIMLGLRTWWVGAVGTTSITLHVVPLTLAYGLVGSLFVAFFAILWAVWRVGKVQPARLLAGGWTSEKGRRAKGFLLRGGAWVAIAIGAVIVGLSLARVGSAEMGFGGGALLLCGGLAWLAGSLRPRAHAGASFVGSGSLTRLGIRNASRHTARGVLSVGLIGFAAFTLITVAAVKQQGVKDPDNKKSETGGYRLILNAGIPLTGDLNTVEGRRLLGIRQPADPIYAGVHFTNLRQWTGQDISCLNLTKPSSPTILGVPQEMIDRGGFIPGDAVKKTDNIWKLLDLPMDERGLVPVIADSDTQEYVLQIGLGDPISASGPNGPLGLYLAGTVAHSIFQGQLLMSDTNFRSLFRAQSGFSVVLIDLPGVPKDQVAARETELARRLSSELDDFAVSVDTTSARLQMYQNVQNTYLETFQTLGALGLMLGTLGLAVVLVRTVIERRGELALLASLGFSSAARVQLILSENAFLLILGLALGTVSAVIGVLPAVLRDARPMNVGSLAGTLAIVLAVGLVSSIIAVGLSGVHVAPADLRRE